jgi:hypothetical protein
MSSNVLTNSNFVLYQTEDGQTHIEVRLQDESVWLAQATLTELFQTRKQNISLHLKNIFAEGELAENRVVKEYLTTAADGKQYRTKHTIILKLLSPSVTGSNLIAAPNSAAGLPNA